MTLDRDARDVIVAGVCGFPKSHARLFRDLALVEVQETFYRPVAVERAMRWRERAPPDFMFAVKASQFITHDATSATYRRSGLDLEKMQKGHYGLFMDTSEVWAGWTQTADVSKAVRARAIVFQTPETFGPTPENLRNLYAFFEKTTGGPWSLVWEPRAPWPSYVVEKVCTDLGLVHCVDPFAGESVTIGGAYFRLHGSPPGERMYSYTYTDGDLTRLRDTAIEYDDAFVVFNNVTMYEDALRFRGIAGDTRAA